jgi:hypothetical protein
MTSHQHPDYDVGLRMSLGDFHAIAGIAFSASVIFSRNNQQVSGMIIVPQGNEFPDSSALATAWLWSGDHTDAPVKMNVSIVLGEPCDPMLEPEKRSNLATHSGLTLEGVITRNWNTELKAGDDS